jgi:DNA-binding PadR family transcriptional regulator
MGLKEGLLCLLAKEDAHGYQLKTDIESTTGEIWQVNIGQVYTTLQRLERDGLVASIDSNGDNRVVYTITDTGREDARDWMATPVNLAASGRDEISLKVLMAIVSGVEEPRRVIEKQRGATMTLLQDYTTLKGDDSNDELAWLLHLDRLILSAEAELRWLERVEARLDAMPGETKPVDLPVPSPEPAEVIS